MKKGAGDDPFAEEDPDNERDVSKETEEGASTDGRSEMIAPTTASESATIPTSAKGESPRSIQQSTEELPYLARRQLKSKSVKTDRDQIPFFLREEVQRGERDLRLAVEEFLDQEVNKTDLREAAYVYAQRNPEGVVEVLHEWGIKYLE
jgi:hypothetical protein